METHGYRVRFSQIKAKKLAPVCLGILTALLLQVFLGVVGLSVAAAQEQPLVPPSVTAKAAIAVDISTGRILYQKKIYDRLPMASTTKLTTALTAFSIPGVNLDEKVTIIKGDLVGEASMGLRLNETISFQDLLWGMLLNSGNDAAETIARYAGSKLPGNGDPVARFVEQMNQYAGKDGLGLLNSHYANPHGLDQDNHFTSAYDLSRIGWYVLHNALLAKIVGTQQAVAAGHSLSNLNTFLKKYPGAIGLKPGFTDNAGLCLVAAATRDGHTVITVVLNSGDINGESATLMNYAFSQLNNSATTLPQGGGPSQSLLAKGDASQYIGYPSGNKLLSPDQAPPNVNSASSSNIAANASSDSNNGFGFGQVINAQVSGTPDASSTPGPDTGGSGGSNSPNNNQNKGGLNFFVLLIILLVILGILYVVARLGFIAGDTGRNVAFRVEDGVIALGHSLRRLLGQLRPGNSEHDEAKPYRTQLPPPRSGSSSSYSSPTSNTAEVNYRDRVQANTRPTNPPAPPSNYSSSGRLAPSSENRPQPTTRPNQDYQAPISSTRSQPLGEIKRDFSSSSSSNIEAGSSQNPLEGFFDGVTPFSFDEDRNIAQVDDSNQQTGVKPPQPLRAPFNNPNNPSTSKPASDTSYSVSSGSLRDNVPPATPRPPTPAKTETQAGQDYNPPAPMPSRPTPSVSSRAAGNSGSKPSSPSSGADSLMKRAQQAVDYAFAGRMQASTDEFRRVIEQDALFDFGGMDDFNQMPVLGFKALANAYSASGKTRFGILLLEMAIEKYPNDLELRNMLRTFRRETGQ